ncbi:MAG: hypothetical protein Kow0090_17880 [Myxococcota bacterium]
MRLLRQELKLTHKRDKKDRVGDEEGVVLLEWNNHPARERPVAAAMLFILIGVAGFLAVVFTGMFLMGALTFLILLGAFNGFLFPSRYRLTADEIIVSTVWGNQRRPLANYRRVVRERKGALISPFSRPHILDSVRGFYIRKEKGAEDLWAALEKLVNRGESELKV